MPDKALPRNARIGFTTMMQRLKIVLDASQPNVVRLLHQDFPLLHGDDIMFSVSGASIVVSAMPAAAVLEPLITCAIEQRMASAPANSILGIAEAEDDEEIIDHFERFKTWSDEELDKLRVDVKKVCNRPGMFARTTRVRRLRSCSWNFLTFWPPSWTP